MSIVLNMNGNSSGVTTSSLWTTFPNASSMLGITAGKELPPGPAVNISTFGLGVNENLIVIDCDVPDDVPWNGGDWVINSPELAFLAWNACGIARYNSLGSLEEILAVETGLGALLGDTRNINALQPSVVNPGDFARVVLVTNDAGTPVFGGLTFLVDTIIAPFDFAMPPTPQQTLTNYIIMRKRMRFLGS